MALAHKLCNYRTDLCGSLPCHNRLKGGLRTFVIPVKASGSTTKRPKVFSRPIPPQAHLPYKILTEGWDKTLKNLKLRAREWKYFLKAYGGASWVVQLWSGGEEQARTPEAPPPLNDIPSPRMGLGGYDPEGFEDAHDADPSRTMPLRTQHPGLFKRGASVQGRSLFSPPLGARGEDSVSSSQPSLSECQEGDAARTKELLKAISLRVQNLERGVARVDSTLVTSFKGVRFELDDVWKEVGVLKLATPVGVEMGSGTMPRFVGRQSQAPSPPTHWTFSSSLPSLDEAGR